VKGQWLHTSRLYSGSKNGNPYFNAYAGPAGPLAGFPAALET